MVAQDASLLVYQGVMNFGKRAFCRVRALVLDVWDCIHSPAALTRTLFLEQARWVLWVPVAFAAGVVFYFAAPTEPSLRVSGLPLVASASLSILCLARLRSKNSPQTVLWLCGALLTVCCSAGFLTTKIRTEIVRAPVIERKMGPLDVVGTIEEVWPQSNENSKMSWRLTLRPSQIGRLEKEKLPRRVRLTVRSDAQELRPGDMVRMRAILMPLPGPAIPNGFDYARTAWFDRIGGLGFALGKPHVIPSQSPQAGLHNQFVTSIANLRYNISEQIQSTIAGPAGAVASALVVGVRHSIPPDTAEAFRATGMAHLLAISGLHMAMVAGLAYFVFRLGLTLIPAFALRLPVRKWAAILGLLTATAYLLLSGASVSTQRAYIMISLVFLAVLNDRQAISMRTVAAAAFVVLLVSPESAIEVGFQMSFAAVVALIAVYETWQYRAARVGTQEYGLIANIGRKIFLYFGGVAVTSIIAGLATGFFATYHFNRIATFGVASNLIVMPLVSVFIMPAIFWALILLPFGLEQFALKPMELGINSVIGLISEIQSWPGAEQYVPQWPKASLSAIVIGGLWLALWRQPWRLLGLAPLILGYAILPFATPPDIFIERDGKNIGMLTKRGDLVILFENRSRFAQESWKRSSGIHPDASVRPNQDEAFSCDVLACVARLPNGQLVSYVLDRRAFEEECVRSDVVVSEFYLPRRLRSRCERHTYIIDRRTLQERGAHTITIEAETLDIKSALDHRGRRPWSEF